jgi:putative FmdB family regulatory protein
MPMYAYECPRCDILFEKFAPMVGAGLPQTCPDCGIHSPRRFLPPTCLSDTTTYRGDNTGLGQFKSDAMREFHLAQARKHGVNTTGKLYDPALAKYPGDPKAWVGSDTDVRQVLESRNWGSTGKVKVKQKSNGETTTPKPGLSEKIVRELVHERMVVDPGQKVSKVVEDVVNDHAPRNGKRIIRPQRRARRAG